jgi:hypothetical protein
VFLIGSSMGGSSATIGSQGDVLTIAQNSGAGIFVTADGSLARIDRSRIVFDSNAGGNIVGDVIDLAFAGNQGRPQHFPGGNIVGRTPDRAPLGPPSWRPLPSAVSPWMPC